MVRQVRVSGEWSALIEEESDSVARRRRRKSKYNVDLTKQGKAARTVDGITFASKAEAKRYQVLKRREEAGEIRDLKLQPRFRLLDGFDYRGEYIQPVNYTADFRYLQDGETVVEEVKGRETRDFKLRKKLFLYRYGDRYRYKQVSSGDVLTHP